MHASATIVCMVADGNYTQFIYTPDIKPALMSTTILRYQEKLPTFIRISKHVLVNTKFIVRYTIHSRMVAYLLMSNGVSYKVSRRRMILLREQLKPYLDEKTTTLPHPPT